MNQISAISVHDIDTSFISTHLGGFLLANIDDIEWVLAASGAHELLAALRSLVEDFNDETAQAEDAMDVLEEIRDVISEVPIYNPFDQLRMRPDFDASVRWLGARLDDLLGSTNKF